jgi:hypothetical protein
MFIKEVVAILFQKSHLAMIILMHIINIYI